MEQQEGNLSAEEEKEISEAAARIDITKGKIGRKEKLIVILVLLGAATLLTISGVILYSRLQSPSTIDITSDEEQLEEEQIEEPQEEEPEEETSFDKDNDGLPDEEEETLWGTDPEKSDTDRDGLTDFEEVRDYGTNPLESDSDGDGFLDGEEVEGGYNPLGPGELTP